MPLSWAQKEIADSTARFRVAVCGRRFGKTTLGIREMAKFARFPERKILYIAPTYRQAKQVVWDDLKAKLMAKNWVRGKPNESDLNIPLVNGSIIMLRSADNYDSIRGIGADFVVFDEFADIDPRAWTEVVRPALSDRLGHALFLGTPKGMGNWAKDLFDKGQMDPDWKSFQYTTLDGGNVPAEEIEAAKADLDERSFRQEYMASFETYSNVIYYSFSMDNVVNEKPSISDKTTLHIGMDFNTNPMSACIAVEGPNHTAIVIDEIVIYGSNTQEMCDEIRNRYPNNHVIVYPDASGGNQNTKGESDHNILRQNGFTVKVNRSNPSVRDRIVAVNSAFKSADGKIKVSINRNCKKLIECLNKQTYKKDTRIPDKESGFDHMNDALGYFVMTVFPVKRPSDIKPVHQTWSHY